MASTHVENKLNKWMAHPCPEFFATLISTFATCWGTVVGLEDQRHLWSKPLSKFLSICAGISQKRSSRASCPFRASLALLLHLTERLDVLEHQLFRR